MEKEVKMKNVLAVLAVALGLAAGGAMAHGVDKAQHGGVVQAAGDLSFELVAEGEGAALYVVDHGKAADTSKFGGKLTVLNGTEKTEVELKPVAANKLVAAPVKLSKGAKAVATVSTAGGKTITVRFSIK
jgi:hypothetical protein